MLTKDTRAAPAWALIESFTGENSWLSNFHDSPLQWQGLWYPHAEAAFQAGKTLDMNLRQRIADAATPGEAKRLGRSLGLRPDWDHVVRHEVMREVLAAKFANPDLAARLVGTCTALLVEGNEHHDQQWGCCRCSKHAAYPGDNLLGRALMRQRSQLDPTLAGRWVRVGVTAHRPHKIPKEMRGWVRDELERVTDKLATEHATEVAITGLALGGDLWFAQAARRADLRVWCYSPSPDQDERWPKVWQKTRAEVIADAERVHHLGPRYDVKLLGRRNRWVVRDSDALVAVYDTGRQDGGTAATVRYATGRIPVILVDLRTQQVRLRPAA